MLGRTSDACATASGVAVQPSPRAGPISIAINTPTTAIRRGASVTNDRLSVMAFLEYEGAPRAGRRPITARGGRNRADHTPSVLLAPLRPMRAALRLYCPHANDCGDHGW